MIVLFWQSRAVFNANQLRKGDQVLVQLGRKQKRAEVVYAKAYSSIGVEFPSGDQKWFSSRAGFEDLVAGARLVNGEWRPL